MRGTKSSYSVIEFTVTELVLTSVLHYAYNFTEMKDVKLHRRYAVVDRQQQYGPYFSPGLKRKSIKILKLFVKMEHENIIAGCMGPDSLGTVQTADVINVIFQIN